MSINRIKNGILLPYKVCFVDGPRHGDVRYYGCWRSAYNAARRYVNKSIPDRFIFSHPCCEIFFIFSDGTERFRKCVIF